jgi:nitrite reductase/ring-hydroxylating ferredoxin subunit
MNPAQPSPGTLLCRLDAIENPGAKGFSFRAGEALFMGFVVRVGVEVFGYLDRCPHTGLPLANLAGGYLTREADLIICASHGALFRRGDGACIAGPCTGRALIPWPVRIEGEAVVAA